ncbi:MAG: roadblock/LC7 domain-containing protein [Candidatus Odinarchaeota archaeon]
MDDDDAAILDRLAIIENVLNSVKIRIPDIQGLVVVTKDGLPIAASLDSRVDEDRISAMTAASLNLAERVVIELNRGELSEMIIKGVDGLVIIMDAGEEAVLTGITHSDAKLGLVLLDMKRAAKKLSELI